MKITILENSKVKYNNHYLIPFQTYNDVDDKTAEELVKSKDAKVADESIVGVSVETAPEHPNTPKFDKDKNGGYVAEAQLTEKQKRDLEEKGKAKNDAGEEVPADATPVVGEDKTLPKIEDDKVEVKQKVYDDQGNELTDEQIRAKEAAAASGGGEKLPTPQEASASGEEVK